MYISERRNLLKLTPRKLTNSADEWPYPLSARRILTRLKNNTEFFELLFF